MSAPTNPPAVPPTGPPTTPAPDATRLLLGRTALWQGIWALTLLLSIGTLILAGGISLLVRTGIDGAPPVAVAVVFLLGTGLAVLGLLAFRRAWQGRDQELALDAAGVWWSDGRTWTPVWWQSLAGAGLYSSKNGRVHSTTLELLPREPVDPHHPALRPHVRREAPHAPGLPDLRYRIVLNSRHEQVATAAQSYAPTLWFGHHRAAPGHVGKPPRA